MKALFKTIGTLFIIVVASMAWDKYAPKAQPYVDAALACLSI